MKHGMYMLGHSVMFGIGLVGCVALIDIHPALAWDLFCLAANHKEMVDAL